MIMHINGSLKIECSWNLVHVTNAVMHQEVVQWMAKLQIKDNAATLNLLNPVGFFMPAPSCIHDKSLQRECR